MHDVHGTNNRTESGAGKGQHVIAERLLRHQVARTTLLHGRNLQIRVPTVLLVFQLFRFKAKVAKIAVSTANIQPAQFLAIPRGSSDSTRLIVLWKLSSISLDS